MTTEERIPFNAMVNNSSLMYSFASLRDVVNDHSLTFGPADNGLEKVTFVKPDLIVTQKDEFDVNNRANAYLKRAVSAANLLEFLQSNRNFYNEDLTFNEKHGDVAASDLDPLYCEDELRMMAEKFDAEFWEFDDKFADSQLVYGVIVNRKDKRTVVAFRGTATMRDIVVDLNGLSTSPDEFNFAHEKSLVPKGTQVKVHRGFNNYLFEDKKDKSGTKFQDVMKDLEDVYAFKNEDYDYSDYKLFITGHSLGGALASLTSVALAGSDLVTNIPAILPITVISYASPRCGNGGFKKLHHALEKNSKIRHIRVTNSGDIIPTLPPFFFTQTGVNIELQKTGNANVYYGNDYSCISQFGCSSPSMHFVDTYEKHLLMKEKKDAKSRDLSIENVLKKSVDQLYLEYANMDSNSEEWV